MSAPRQKRTCVAQNSVPQMNSSHVDRANRPNTRAHGAEVKTARCHTAQEEAHSTPRLHFIVYRGGPLRVPSGEFSLRNSRLISPALFGPLNLLAGHHTLMRLPGVSFHCALTARPGIGPQKRKPLEPSPPGVMFHDRIAGSVNAKSP